MIKNNSPTYYVATRLAGSRPKRGFILMMVLLAIVVVGVALTTTAQRSLHASLAAIESHESLQRHWGMKSLQQVLLPAAPQLFNISDLRTVQPRGQRVPFPSTMQDRILLGGQVFDLILADEDAKANLNAIYDVDGARGCEQTVNKLVGLMEARSVRLLPTRESHELATRKKAGSVADQSDDDFVPVASLPPAFRSWGEVFDLVQINRVAGDDRQLATMTNQLTIFGTGRLNVFRATDAAIEAVCGAVVEPALAKRVATKIRESSLNETDLILEQAVTNEENRKALQRLLGSSSTSFSLWTEASGKRSRKQRFAVQTVNQFGLMRTSEFSFE